MSPKSSGTWNRVALSTDGLVFMSPQSGNKSAC